MNQDRDFVNYIASYTTGTISNQTEIVLEFNKKLPDNDDYLSSKIATFSPNIDGELKKFNNRTLIFTPAPAFGKWRLLFGGAALEKTFFGYRKAAKKI